ncbi:MULTISPECIES: type II secretion system protein [unclassified Paludibacterium]|uniref:type II secretion system protein n=1 Tax=unclassified Paludibacterium TaxID=2618429 RepID=UPI001C049C26|nr:type II secretion system protein [Paludibacterium sp. B53371]BEV73045.1 hypothetical protein THUN1379_25270 [Paludibacterium sp. THUN1379]
MPAGKAQRGYVLLGLLVALMVLGMMLQYRVHDLSAEIQREHEQSLLETGDAIADALGRYAADHQGLYPTRLAQLVDDDSDGLKVRHYLRRLSPDPMTGSGEWGLQRGPGDGITAVFSQSTLTPFKQDGFDSDHEGFRQKSSYQEWVFAARQVVAPAPASP